MANRAAKLTVGDLLIVRGSPTEVYRVTLIGIKAGHWGGPGPQIYAEVLPYQRGGHGKVLFKYKSRWTDGNWEYVPIGA